MIVRLRKIATNQFPELTPGQSYAVMGIEADDLRLINDEGRPYLYPMIHEGSQSHTEGTRRA
jgi:hypothetical protein